MEYYGYYPSPVGMLLLTCRDDALTGVWMTEKLPADRVRKEDHPVLLQTKAWLDEYFRGGNPAETVPLAPEGTGFQQRVWKLLMDIPYGSTCSYGELARQLGAEKMSAQAVGGAVGRNPISILIPCHRVVGSKGQLTGYAGGLENKKKLLALEGRQIVNDRIV